MCFFTWYFVSLPKSRKLLVPHLGSLSPFCLPEKKPFFLGMAERCLTPSSYVEVLTQGLRMWLHLEMGP